MTQSNKEVLIPTDIYDNDGEMVKIEFNTRSGEFVLDAVWDPDDEQTSDNRVKFREWAYRMVGQLGYKILK